MNSPGSISMLIQRFKAGDEAALATLHRRCWPEMVGRARAKLGRRLADADEEDVAQEAFVEFCKSVQAGGLPGLENRSQLRAFLTTVIAHNAINRVHRQLAAKRGAGKVTSLSPVQFLVSDATAEQACQDATAECYEHYVARLPDDLRKLADLYLLGWSHDAMAKELNCVRRTVIRKLEQLRGEWQGIARACGDF